MTSEEMKELKGLAASMGLYDDKNPCKRAVILGKAIKALEQEPCEDAISRQAVRHILNHEVKMPIKVWKKVFELVDDLPPVTPQPKTGHWISLYDEVAKVSWYECDHCHNGMAFSTDYCPYCGCRMIEAQERSDKE